MGLPGLHKKDYIELFLRRYFPKKVVAVTFFKIQWRCITSLQIYQFYRIHGQMGGRGGSGLREFQRYALFKVKLYNKKFPGIRMGWGKSINQAQHYIEILQCLSTGTQWGGGNSFNLFSYSTSCSRYRLLTVF